MFALTASAVAKGQLLPDQARVDVERLLTLAARYAGAERAAELHARIATDPILGPLISPQR